MSTKPPAQFIGPLRQRSFRFQWPADLACSWAFEMETLILGWYVLIETGSVVWLTSFAALQFAGTLISPMFGVVGDRVGHRRLLVGMRAWYAVLAAAMAALALTGTLGILPVFALALLSGLVRPSDIGMRNALIGGTMPAAHLTAAMGIERTSADTARIVGALTGTALVAWLGVGQAYLVVVLLYVVALLLMRGVAETAPSRAAVAGQPGASVWFDLKDGVGYVRGTPPLLAAMCLAFFANLVAYPLTGGLLPHVARDVYGLDQTGLGRLAASFAAGALLGSIFLGARGGRVHPARTMLLAALLWFALLLAYAVLRDPALGLLLLFAIGVVQSFCMVPMSVLLIRVARPAFRGRVMGLRILAVYGLPVGLLAAGPLIAWAGFTAAALLYAALGLAVTLVIALRWRAHLWPREAPANARAL